MARALLRFQIDDERRAKEVVTSLQQRAREHGIALELLSLTGHGDGLGVADPLQKATGVWSGMQHRQEIGQ